MGIFLIILLCIIVVIFNTIAVHTIPDKIKNKWLSLLAIVVGEILSFGFLLLIGLLGKALDVFDETKACIIITFEIELFIITVRNFWDRCD